MDLGFSLAFVAVLGVLAVAYAMSVRGRGRPEFPRLDKEVIGKPDSDWLMVGISSPSFATVKQMESELDSDAFILRASDAKWVTTNIPGIEFKILYKDEDDRTMLIARFAPGASLPSHKRLGTEECLVLSGDFWADGIKLGAGDFIAGLAGEEPDPVYSEGGCELLLKLPIPREIFPN